MPLSAGTRLGPYEVSGPLGAGGMGEVYRARDTRLGREVAIKVIAAKHAAGAVLAERFQREARAASALNHPNIVTIHDIGECEFGHYLVMEFIAGQTLRAAAPSLDYAASTRAIAETARALAAAHAAGIVHRDIKLENIMLRADGYVKVLDFGVARVLPQADDETATMSTGTALTRPGTTVGTVDYMAPEQARSGEVSGASDIFSLGVVFYELVTRRLPFHSDQWFETLHRITADQPAPPSRFAPGLPACLEDLILAMLEKDPARRPHAAEVAAQLSAAPLDGGAAQPAPTRHVVGRAAERDRLLEAAEAAFGGRGGIVLVHGEPGLGKTTLVETTIREITLRRRFRVASGRCSERLASAEPYLPWIEALGVLAVGPQGAAFVLAMTRTAPSWHRQIASGDGAPAGPVTPDRAQREIVRLFEETSLDTPLLLFLEDLHWSDDASVDLLAQLASRVAQMRILVVGTYRPSELVQSGHPLLRLKLDLQSRGICHDIPLQLLAPADVERYLALEFPNHGLAAGFARLVHERTDGSPLFMVEIVRYLRDRGAIALRDGAWVLTASAEEIGRDLPESVRSMIERKIGLLDDQDRRLLQVAAVQGVQFDSSTLSEAAKLDPAAVEDRLEALERLVALVRHVGDGEFPDGSLTLRFVFQHALYQNALYDSIRATQRTVIARSVAEALLRRFPRGSSEIEPQLAFLFETARDPGRAARHCAGAAWHALGKAAPRESVAVARRGLALLEKLPPSADRDTCEAELLSSMGVPLTMLNGFSAPELGKVYERAREIAERAGNRTLMLEALTGLFSWYGMGGDCPKSLANAESVVEVARAMNDADEMVNADRSLAFILAHMARFTEALAAFARLIAAYDPARYERHVTRYAFDPLSGANSFLAWVRTARGDLAGGLNAGRTAIRRGEQINAAQSLGLAWCFNAFLRELRREYEDCLECAETAVRYSEARELAIFPQYGRIWGGWAMACLGDPAGPGRIREGLAGLDAMGAFLSRPHFLALLAEAEWCAGNTDAARGIIEESLEWATRSGNTYYAVPAWRLYGEMAATASEAEGAFARSLALADQQGVPFLALRTATAFARLRLKQGRAEEIPGILAARLAPFAEEQNVPDVRAARELLNLRSA